MQVYVYIFTPFSLTQLYFAFQHVNMKYRKQQINIKLFGKKHKNNLISLCSLVQNFILF